MRTFISFIIITSMLFTSCGNNQSKDKEKAKEATEQSTSESDDFKKSKDCDEFLDQYEEWMDNYIVTIEKYMKNPMDAALAQEFQKVGQEGANWMTQWNSKLVYCSSVEKYQKRIDEITEKADKKLKEMGID